MKKNISYAEYVNEIKKKIVDKVDANGGKLRFLRELNGYIDTIEVAPVVHAKWVECDWLEPCIHGFGTIRHKNEGLKCTNCVHVFKKDLLWRDNYCPNCGAKMDSSGD